jgi:AraC-like DNA-binding protein
VAQFSPAFIGQPGLPELARAAPLLERAAVGLAIRGACCAQVIPNLVAMQACGAIGRLGRLLEILDVLVDHEPDLIPIAQSSMRVPDARVDLAPTSRRIDRVVGWIHRELGRTLTVAEGAHVARITPGGFSRYFRTAVGKTFTQYVNDVRCGEACLRLRRSDKAVALIAAECGFETMSHFNRQFRLRMGMTPRDFRRGRPLGSIHEARP